MLICVFIFLYVCKKIITNFTKCFFFQIQPWKWKWACFSMVCIKFNRFLLQFFFHFNWTFLDIKCISRFFSAKCFSQGKHSFIFVIVFVTKFYLQRFHLEDFLFCFLSEKWKMAVICLWHSVVLMNKLQYLLLTLQMLVSFSVNFFSCVQ